MVTPYRAAVKDNAVFGARREGVWEERRYSSTHSSPQELDGGE